MKTVFRLGFLVALVVLLIAGCTSAAPTPDPEVARLKGDLTNVQGQLNSLQGQLGASQSQVASVQAKLDQANKDLAAARADKTAAESKVSAAMAQVAQLQEQLNKLKQDNQLVGATKAETAEKIVKFYASTHVYSIGDLFECGDMSMDVWNMLKAQNINAKIQIGGTTKDLKEIQDSDHAWVLAEVGPAQYLALETTSGGVVTQQSNPYYYKGWSFKNPKDFKDYVTLLNEYIVRQKLVNDMITRYNTMVSGFNTQYGGRPPADAQGRATQAMDEINLQKATLPPLMAKMVALVG